MVWFVYIIVNTLKSVTNNNNNINKPLSSDIRTIHTTFKWRPSRTISIQKNLRFMVVKIYMVIFWPPRW